MSQILCLIQIALPEFMRGAAIHLPERMAETAGVAEAVPLGNLVQSENSLPDVVRRIGKTHPQGKLTVTHPH